MIVSSRKWPFHDCSSLTENKRQSHFCFQSALYQNFLGCFHILSDDLSDCLFSGYFWVICWEVHEGKSEIKIHNILWQVIECISSVRVSRFKIVSLRVSVCMSLFCWGNSKCFEINQSSIDNLQSPVPSPLTHNLLVKAVKVFRIW